MGTLHCVLENEADLYINERHKIRHYHARSAEERRRKEEEEERRMPNLYIFLLRAVRIYMYIQLRYIAMLYTHSIGNQL